eukprot:GHRR01011317.1.p1 GENE.GHRR01011317.1~~GHRR01011317.1.p1  ORF type:complete len:180 (+),score=44.44 GHRR01011317.1:217-756(+)
MKSSSMGDKLLEADKLMGKGNKYWAPSLLDLRLKPDWEAAAPLFEKAALLYKVCDSDNLRISSGWPYYDSLSSVQQVGQLEKSRAAYEQAAQSQEKIGSVWHAAKHLETCGQISKDLGQLDKMADFIRQAGSFFAQAGRLSAGMRCFPCTELLAGAAMHWQHDTVHKPSKGAAARFNGA